jgi:hypothetical protein
MVEEDGLEAANDDDTKRFSSLVLLIVLPTCKNDDDVGFDGDVNGDAVELLLLLSYSLVAVFIRFFVVVVRGGPELKNDILILPVTYLLQVCCVPYVYLPPTILLTIFFACFKTIQQQMEPHTHTHMQIPHIMH